MIRELVELFSRGDYIELLRDKLPYAFEVAEAECRRVQMRKGITQETTGQEVGLLREKVLVAFLRHILGDMRVVSPSANTTMIDVLVCGTPVEIKSASKSGKVKAKWTANESPAKATINTFSFSADMLLARVWWDKDKESLFYVPREILQEVSQGKAPSEYLILPKGNSRGIDFKPDFIRGVEDHPCTTRVSIDWQKRGVKIDPLERWQGYWASTSGRDPLYL